MLAICADHPRPNSFVDLSGMQKQLSQPPSYEQHSAQSCEQQRGRLGYGAQIVGHVEFYADGIVRILSVCAHSEVHRLTGRQGLRKVDGDRIEYRTNRRRTEKERTVTKHGGKLHTTATNHIVIGELAGKGLIRCYWCYKREDRQVEIAARV